MISVAVVIVVLYSAQPGSGQHGLEGWRAGGLLSSSGREHSVTFVRQHCKAAFSGGGCSGVSWD